MSETPRDSIARHALAHSLIDSAQSMLTIVVVALFCITFIAQPFRIPSQSMEPTLLVGDFLLVDKQELAPPGHWGWLLPYREPERGNIVIFRFPPNPKEDVVKRIVALPGEDISLHTNALSVDGDELHEPYAFYKDSPTENFRDNFPSLRTVDPEVDPAWWPRLRAQTHDGELHLLEDGSYFVMGDNRNDSLDSRYWGTVSRSALIGRPLINYLSLNVGGRKAVGEDTSGGHIVRWGRMFRTVR